MFISYEEKLTGAEFSEELAKLNDKKVYAEVYGKKNPENLVEFESLLPSTFMNLLERLNAEELTAQKDKIVDFLSKFSPAQFKNWDERLNSDYNQLVGIYGTDLGEKDKEECLTEINEVSQISKLSDEALKKSYEQKQPQSFLSKLKSHFSRN